MHRVCYITLLTLQVSLAEYPQIRALTEQYQCLGLKVLVISDGLNISEEALFGIAKPTNQAFNPTLVLVGTRLGIDRVTPAYWDALMACLQLPQSVGIAG